MHAKLVGQRESLTVLVLGCLYVGRVAVGGDLAEQPKGPRLSAPLSMGAGKSEHLLGAL